MAASSQVPEFRNVDLDIESKSALRPLERELGDRVSVMFSGRLHGHHCLSLETGGKGITQEEIINELCALIETLSPQSRKLWDSAVKREFDLGYGARLANQRANRIIILPKTVRRVAKLGASFAVTFYRD
jgi:hypothetical protein